MLQISRINFLQESKELNSYLISCNTPSFRSRPELAKDKQPWQPILPKYPPADKTLETYCVAGDSKKDYCSTPIRSNKFEEKNFPQ